MARVLWMAGEDMAKTPTTWGTATATTATKDEEAMMEDSKSIGVSLVLSCPVLSCPGVNISAHFLFPLSHSFHSSTLVVAEVAAIGLATDTTRVVQQVRTKPLGGADPVAGITHKKATATPSETITP